MIQLTPSLGASPARPVNVASVPQRSPFRYPGGKTWLVPYIRRWLGGGEPVEELIEPFAGGAIVGLTAAFEGLAAKVRLVELDEDVAAVWQTILNGDAEWLAERIAVFDVSPETVRAALDGTPESVRERAFATIVRNRVSRGGIMAPGSGLMKRGEDGRGLASRWYAETLAGRILDIAALRNRVQFVRADGISVIEANSERGDVAFFIDPPYTGAGRRLYRHSDLDHEGLFELASRLSGNFLMTYDDTDHIRALAQQHGFDVREVVMKTTHHSRKMELLVGRGLDWVGA
jgi:DNA adenine methylase